MIVLALALGVGTPIPSSSGSNTAPTPEGALHAQSTEPVPVPHATSTTIVIPAPFPTDASALPTDTPTAAPTAAATSTAVRPVQRATTGAAAGPTNTPANAISITPSSAPVSPAPLASSATPTVSSTSAQVIANQIVLMPRISPSATTGITSTDLVSLTTVPAPVVPVRLPTGTINIALLGLDTRPSLPSDPSQINRGSKNTDIILIASIQPSVPAVTLLSIPRDTLVYLPNSRFAKVNTAYAYGGPDYFKQTIKYNFGLNVDYYTAINFSAVVDAVHTLGGIEVVATCPLYQVFPKDPYYLADETSPLTVTVAYTDSFTGEVWQPGQPVPTQTIWIPRAGVYSLNGLQTLAFARTRYGVPTGDLDRGRRTQIVARAMLTKARSNGLAFFTQLPALIEQFGRNVQTDLTVDQLLSLASLANQYEDTVIRSRYFDGVGLTGMTLSEVGSVLIPNRDSISAYLQQAMNVPANQQSGNAVPVELVNGTGWRDFSPPAIARLHELDFDVVSVKDLQEIVTRTQVVDFTTTSKGSALPRLERAFNLRSEQVTSQPQADGPRYRIIAGRDFDVCYYKNFVTSAAVTPVITPTLALRGTITATATSKTPVAPGVPRTPTTPPAKAAVLSTRAPIPSPTPTQTALPSTPTPEG